VCVCQRERERRGGGGGREKLPVNLRVISVLIWFLIWLRDHAVIIFCGVVQRCTNPGCQVTQVARCCTVALNVCGASVWK
jgi:hypothetical protein